MTEYLTTTAKVEWEMLPSTPASQVAGSICLLPVNRPGIRMATTAAIESGRSIAVTATGLLTLLLGSATPH